MDPQVATTIRTALKILGMLPVGAALFAWLHIDPTSDFVVTGIGFLIVVGAAIWSGFSHTTNGVMAAAKNKIDAGVTPKDVAPVVAALNDAGASATTAGMPLTPPGQTA